MTLRPLTPLLLTALALGCGAADDAGDPARGPDPLACGVTPCTTPDEADFDPAYAGELAVGKADADSVEAAIAEATADGVLDAGEVAPLFEAAGNTVNPSEMALIRDALSAEDYEVTEDAAAAIRLTAWTHNLAAPEAERVALGYTFAATEAPQAVRELIIRARLNGAIAYDVNEKNDEGEGVWSPYPATTPASDNMAFDYTEITPAALAADQAAEDLEYRAITGTEDATLPDGRTYRRAAYEDRVGGTGHVLSHYDEVYHPDIYARGRQGQRWANNCAILSDGSIHCLPAARRSIRGDVILTNPHLSRGAHMLYNGHIDIRAGVVVAVEMSGRLAKRAARGKAIFVDPLLVLEAWGFEIAPGLEIRWGNTSRGVPFRDVDAGVIRQADPEPDPIPDGVN
jgi:hypothetical protein